MKLLSHMILIAIALFASFSVVASGKYELVRGDPYGLGGRKYCWKIGTKDARAGSPIVLAECNVADERQRFQQIWYTGENDYVGDSVPIEFVPKLAKDLRVGTKKLKNSRRLRLVNKNKNNFHKFYIDEHGLLGIGGEDRDCTWEWWSAANDCLFVTNIGKNNGKAVSGDEVVILRKGRISRMQRDDPEAILITSWIDY